MSTTSYQLALHRSWLNLSSIDLERAGPFPFCWRPLPIQPDGGQTPAMPIKNRSLQPPAEKPNGEGWLANADQQQVVHFKPDIPTAHGEWVILRTFHWQPPAYPIPQMQRRMLRHNAIEAWQTMLKTGWQRCAPPLR